MATALSSGAGLLIVGYRSVAEPDGAAIALLGQLGETLLAAPGRWWVRRLSPVDSDRLAPTRANLKLQLDELAARALDAVLIVIAGELTGPPDAPALVTGRHHGDYPEEASLPLAWIRDRVLSGRTERALVVVSGRTAAGAPPSAAAWLAALRTDRATHAIAVDHAGDGAPLLAALLAGLAGDAHDPRTGTVTLRSLCRHLARAVPDAAMQPSIDGETVAMVAPLGGPWGPLASRHVLAGAITRPAPEAGPDDLTGMVLPGRFRLDELLASGSFGTVYRARQLAVDRDVAVKVLHADIDPASDDGRLFIHEIQAVGRIDHGGVVRIFQADIAPGGRLFFAMELLDGRDLQWLVDHDGPLPPARALALVGQLLAALAAAHDAGLVHADVKPGNAIVVGAGVSERLVLVDFGMARLRPPNQAAESVGGTPAYMAPEQLRDGRVDARSDLFAAALVLVTLLTGWCRDDGTELVPPLAPIADPALREVLARALAIDPAARYQTAGELAAALAGGPPSAAAAAVVRSPFRHLAPFTERDAGHLHGRERDLAALVEQVLFRHVIVYTAPSGTGKTSLLRAGLVPRLQGLGARPIYLAARPDSRAALVAAITRRTEGSTRRTDAPDAPDPAGDLAAAITAWHARDGGRLIVILDQLETAVTDPEGSAALVRELLGLAHGPADPEVAIVLSVREDFLGRLLALDPRLQAGVPVVRLPPLDRDGARAAIVEALTGHRIAIEPALLERLLADLEAAGAAIGPELGWGAGPAIYPPHLQLACSVLHDTLAADEATLTLAHYRRLGGFEAIVGEYLDRVLDSELDATAAGIARALFVALVTSAHTRAFRSEAELLELAAAPDHDEPAIRAVLDTLAGRGLLVRLRGPDGEPGWELIHDSLVPRVEAWLDRRDLSRRRAIELLRHHLHRSTADAPSLLARDDLRELRAHADAIATLDAEWQRRGAAWTPARLIARSQRALRRRTAALLAAALLLTAAGALLIARWSAERDRRRHEQTLRDRDLGRFVLELHAFDWNVATHQPDAVAIADLPALAWHLHTPSELDRLAPGLPRDFVDRRDTPASTGGARAWEVDTRGGEVLLVITGRGRDGARCSDAIVPIARLPGYAQRGGAPIRIRIRVPTCQATRADTIEIPGGPFARGGAGDPPSTMWAANPDHIERTALDLPAFAIDRTEVTNAEFRVFADQSDVTHVLMPEYPNTPSLGAAGGARYPVAAITWFDARAYCKFLGKDLPTTEQWEKAMRGGLVLPDGPNPAPDRNLPWGTPDLSRANISDVGTRAPVAVDELHRDRSPYGVIGLAGNVQEWTSSVQVVGGKPMQALRITRGGNWDDTPSAELVEYMAMENSRPMATAAYAVGVRCVLAGP